MVGEKLYNRVERIGEEWGMKEFTVVIEKDEDNWLVSMVLELPGCHSQGKTMDELLERTREAIGVYLEALDERELEPRIEFVGVQRVKV